MSRRVLGAATALLLCLGGCGPAGDPLRPEREASVPARRAGDAPHQSQTLVIDSVRLVPREPAKGDTLRAMTVVRDASRGSFELDHRWFVDDIPLPNDGPMLLLDEVPKGAQVRIQVVATEGATTSEPAEDHVTVIDRLPTLIEVALVPPEEIAPGQPLSARALAADPDGDPIEYEYTWYVNGRPVETEGALFDTEGLHRGDAITVEIRAGDGARWTRSKRAPPVLVGGAHPEITSAPPGIRDNGEFRYEIVARDPDGERLRFHLVEGPEGMAIDEVLGVLLWRPDEEQEGVHPVEIEVRDSSGMATRQSFEVSVRRGDGHPETREGDPVPLR